ncbi:MAG: methyltransferase, partial [Bacillota bacterium]
MININSRERFYATIERRPVDRPASWLGLPVPDSIDGLFEYFSVENIDQLKRRLGDDVYPVELPYHSPAGDAIYEAFDFAKDDSLEERTLTAPGFFEDYSQPEAVEEFEWPEPQKYIDSR